MAKNKKESKKKDFKGSRKPNSKGKHYYDVDKETDNDVTKPDPYNNDDSWLSPNEALLQQVGGFSFNNTIGINSPLRTTPSDSAQIESTQIVGNIMEVQLFPFIGPKAIGNNKAAINAAALKLYNQMSADNSKTTKYLPEDIAFAILAVGEVISWAANFQRAYGCAFNMSPRNRTIPYEQIDAMGLNPADFSTHLADYRLEFNAILTVASNIRMIADIPYFNKCATIYQDVFYDKGSAMAQYYIMRPRGYLLFSEGTYDPNTGYFTGSTLDWVDTPSSMTGTTYLNHLRTMVNAVLSSTTFNYIFTDIVRLIQRQGGQLLGLNYLPEIYQVTPVFSETFMTQVHNMTWGMFEPMLANTVTPYQIFDDPTSLSVLDNMSVILDLGTKPELVALLGDKILDFPYTDNPTPSDILHALEFKAMGDLYVSDSSSQFYGRVSMIAANDHPVAAVYMHYVSGSSSTRTVFNNYQDATASIGSTLIPHMSTFDIVPSIYARYSGSRVNVHIGALNYFTNVSTDQVRRIVEYNLLAVFGAEVGNVKLL